MLVQTVTKDTEDLNNTVTVFDLTSIYTLTKTIAKYTFLSNAHGTSSGKTIY